MLFNLFLSFSLAVCTSSASTQTLTEALASQNVTLSVLNGLLASQPAMLQTLTSATDVTIVAPNNAAFDTLLSTTTGKASAQDPGTVASILQYHVLKGIFTASNFTSTYQFIPTLLTNATQTMVTGGQVVEAVSNNGKAELFSALKQKAVVVTADIFFTGGVLHIIDTVMSIPIVPSFTAIDSNLTAFAGALGATSLLTTVDSLKDVTIFAPSNAAFQAIGSATGNLTTQQLAGILEYHVANGTVGYSSLLSNTTLGTLQGGSVNVEVGMDGAVFVNSARVIIADIITSSGVMHVLDNVLNPANSTATPIPAATVQAVAFAGAASVSTVPFTMGIVPTTTAPSASTKTAAARKVSEGESKGVAAALFGIAVLAVL